MEQLRRHVAPVVLVVWTFLVWTTRFGTIWGDDELDTVGKWGRTALALTFTLLAALVAVAIWRRASTMLQLGVVALAGWTTVVWVVRAVGIVAADHELGFTVVHLVLAVVSTGLSAWAMMATAPRPEPVSGSGSPHPP